MLDASDIRLIWGDGSTAVDLTAAGAVQSLRCRAGGSTDELRPVGRAGVERVPISVSRGWSATVWAGDAVDGVDDVDDGAGWLAVILAASGTGWVTPSRLLDGARDSDQTQPTSRLATVDLMWTPRAAGDVISAVAELDSDGDHPITVDAGSRTWLALTTAGTVDGAARTVGVAQIDVTSPVTVAGARGWVLAAAAEQAG